MDPGGEGAAQGDTCHPEAYHIAVKKKQPAWQSAAKEKPPPRAWKVGDKVMK
jgi:hypothetical protein